MLKVNIPQCLKSKDFERLGTMLTDDFTHKDFYGTFRDISIVGKSKVIAFYTESYKTSELQQFEISFKKIVIKPDEATVRVNLYALFLDLPTNTPTPQQSETVFKFKKANDNSWQMSSVIHYFK